MNIINDKPVMIFKRDDGKYVVGVSKKNGEEYENAYFPIQFNKGVEVHNKTQIKIKNAWLSFYNWNYEDKKGTTFFIKCSDFEEIDREEKSETEILKEVVNGNPFEEFGQSIEISEDDLPFKELFMEFLIYIWWVIKFTTFVVITILIGLGTEAILINILGLIMKMIWRITDFIEKKKKGGKE